MIFDPNGNARSTVATFVKHGGRGLAPSDDRESTITGLFAPGPYTAIVHGKNNGTGIGLMEIYQTQ